MSIAPSTPAAARELRDDHHVGEAAADRAERGARVETEPAEPQHQHGQAHQRHVVAGDRVRLAVIPVLALARAEQQQGRQRAGGADQVHHRGAGEVLHPEVRLEPAAAEDPVADDRVDQRAEDHRVDQVRAELDALDRGAPHDRERHRAEHELEEELGRNRRLRELHRRERRSGPWCRGTCPRYPRTSPRRRRRARSRRPSSRAPLSRSSRGSSARPCRRSSSARSRPRGRGSRPA